MEPLQRMLARARTFWAGLSPVRRILVSSAVALVVIALAAFSYLGQSGEMVALYSEPRSTEEIGQIGTKLKALNKPFEYDLVYGIKVPAKSRFEYLVALANEGIPVGLGKGLSEITDSNALTSTPFMDRVKYQSAMQSELSRFISLYPGVHSARVMIAQQPDKSAFLLRDKEPPSVSVFVIMKPGARLTTTSAQAINRLVTHALPGMKPENVSIADTNGGQWNELSKTDQDTQSTVNLKIKKEFEDGLKEKAELMLAKALGKERVMVSVTADLDFKKVKDRRHSIIPEEKGVERESTRESKSTNTSSGGVAGATSNTRQVSGGGRGSGTSSETASQVETKYSQQIRDTDDHNIPITRLSIAAIVDLSPPTVAEGQTAPKVMTLKEVEDMIKGAIGFDEKRDQLKITNTPLPGTAMPAFDDDETAKIQRLSAYVSLARNISLAVAVVMAITLIPLLLLRRRAKLTAAAAAAAVATPTPEQRHQERVQRLIDLARTDPDRVATVFGLMTGAPAA